MCFGGTRWLVQRVQVPASRCRWMLIRLRIVQTGRHSLDVASSPLRENRRNPRLAFDVPEHRLDDGLAFGVGSGPVFGGQKFHHGPTDLDRVEVPSGECRADGDCGRMANTRSGNEPWLIYFFRRHSADDRGESVPGRDFLDACPTKVRATMLAVLGAVADAPPPRFSGGGYWEVMRDEMAGYYEVRVNGPQRKHFRLSVSLSATVPTLGSVGRPSSS